MAEGETPPKRNLDALNAEMEAVKVSVDSHWDFSRGEMAKLRRDFTEWKGRLDYLEVNMQVVVSDTLKKYIDDFRQELNDKLNASKEKKLEIGREIIKEFEKSYVGRHAERLATTEMKVRMLDVELEKLRGTLIDAPRSEIKKDVPDLDSMASFESCAGDVLLCSGKLPTSPFSCAALEADVDSLRADLQRLVSSELRCVVDNVKQMQIQSAEMIDIIENNKVDLQGQVQRMESANSEKLAELTETLRRELQGMVQKASVKKQQTDKEFDVPEVLDEHQYASSILISTNQSNSDSDEGFVDQDSTKPGISNSQSVSSDSSQCGASDDKLDLDSEKLDLHGAAGGWESGLREELLSYLRSEVKDHVLSVLREEHSHTFVRCQAFPPSHVCSAENSGSVRLDSFKPSPTCSPRISTRQTCPAPSSQQVSSEVRPAPSLFSSPPPQGRGSVRAPTPSMSPPPSQSPPPNRVYGSTALPARPGAATPRRPSYSQSPSPGGSSAQARTRAQIYAAHRSSAPTSSGYGMLAPAVITVPMQQSGTIFIQSTSITPV